MAQYGFEGEIENITECQLAFINSVIDREGFQGSKVTFQSTGAVGDNYAANVKRIVIEGENGNITMIAKIAPTHEVLRKKLNSAMLFGNEHLMYTEVLPKLLQLQKQADVPEAGLLKFPKCYGTNIEAPNEVILLEDLKTSGFVMVDRLVSLTDEQVTSVLKNLAVFHSLSYVLKTKDPQTYDNYKDNLKDMWGSMAEGSPEELAYFLDIENSAIGMLDDPEHKIAMKNIVSDVLARAAKITKWEDGSRFAVIQHGDCWTNNFMFKIEDEQVKESLLIDYQLSKNSSPANDLLYLIFNCTDHETRVKHFYDWFDYYHSELDKSLSNYGLKANYVYPKDQLDADVKRYGKLAFGVAIICATVLLLNPEEAAKMKEALASENLDDTAEAMSDLNVETLTNLKKRLIGLAESFISFGLL